jgi:hypothetical protein
MLSAKETVPASPKTAPRGVTAPLALLLITPLSEAISDGDLWRMQACKIAAEAGGDFNGDCQLSASQALLHLRRGVDRTLFGEIA